ncbi:MAG TPA: peptidylprolyl isomerase [Candidatus Deferrimicrobiaceae bacterium]
MKRIIHGLMLGAVASMLFIGCSSKSAVNETVATVDGKSITVMEVREATGIPGGLVPASTLDKDQKRKLIGQIIETRLLAREARAIGLDNTQEFKDAIRFGESGVAVKGLFRKELDAKGQKVGSEIDAAVKDLMAKDKSLKASDARARASQSVFSAKLSQIQTEITAAARKAFPEKVDTALIARIAKGEDVPDNAAVGQVGSEAMTYGDAKVLISKATMGAKHAGKDFLRDEKALAGAISQELGDRSLVAYARQQGGDKGPWLELDRTLYENSVLLGLLAEKVIFKDLGVSEKEIENTYNEHKNMFVKDGKLVPLAAVRDQIVAFLQDQKKRKAVEAFVAPLKGKAKISIVESMLEKV